MFNVTVNGHPFQEMHVDGGAFAQAFLYPASVTRLRQARLRRGEWVAPTTAYIIRNGRLDPEWSAVERRTMSIAGRAISTMITVSGYNDVLKMYASAQQDNIGFNLDCIGSAFSEGVPAPLHRAV